MTKNGCIMQAVGFVDRNFNNGYRHLYRCVEPNTIPYTLETFDDKFRRVCHKDSISKGAFIVGTTLRYTVYIGNTQVSWEDAYKRYEWPDGSVFGVEVTR